MKNYNSIHHEKLKRIYDLTGSHNKAMFLEKCIYFWQISKFTLGDNKIWFTRSLKQMATELNLSERTISRYLSQLCQSGHLEKINKLCIKKRLYIRVTDKLLSHLDVSKKDSINELKINSSEANAVINTQESLSPPQECSFLNQLGVIEKDNLALSIYKDKDTKSIVNNNVSVSLSVDKTSEKSKQNNISPLYPTYKIEELMGDIITTHEKNYIKGMLANLKKQYQLEFSSPEQLFAEIVFCVKNEAQLQGIHDFNHRIQIIAKLLRQKRWLTPKGFYNHSAFGAFFKKQPEKSESTRAEKPTTTPTNQSNNKKHELLQNIKTLESTLNESVMRMYSEINYYKTIRFSHGKLTSIPDSLAQSVLQKIKIMQQNQVSLHHDIDSLAHQLETMKGIGYAMIHNNFEYFEKLREKYLKLKSKTDWAQEQLTQATLNSPEETVLIDIYKTEHQRLVKDLTNTESKMSIIAEKLFCEKAA